MNPEQDSIEPFDPAHNLADTATEFEDDDRDDFTVEPGSPAPAVPGGGTDG